mgnify:FL=1
MNNYKTPNNMSASVHNKVNRQFLRMAKEQLAEANRCFELGDYDRAFDCFGRSVEKSCRMLQAAAGEYDPKNIFTDRKMSAYRIDDQFASLAELLSVFDTEDEKLDLLHAFLNDSGMEALAGGQARCRLFLYRQMVLSFVAGLDNRCRSVADAADAEALERNLNLKFALAAYLEPLMAYQQWCLEFVERNERLVGQALTNGPAEIECLPPVAM